MTEMTETIESRPDLIDERGSSRVFCDVARLLASATDPDTRVGQVLTLLRSLVAYDECAVLDASPGRLPHLLTCSKAPAGEKARLLALMTPLLSSIGSETLVSDVYSTAAGQLAIPLVSLDTVVGLLFVERALGPYDERDVHVLSVFAAQLGAYFSMLQARARDVELTRQLEGAKQKGTAASQAKDELLALVSHQLRTPLNTILAWADTLRAKGASDAERDQAFQAIGRSVRVQSALIDDLLERSDIAEAAPRLDLSAVAPTGVDSTGAVGQPESVVTRKKGHALSGIHVLLVDDDRDICEVLQFVLEGQGAVVTVAGSVAAALLALDRSMPHVLLSDIAMPGATGHDLMRKVLALRGADAPPAAALSAYARAQDVQMATASGFQMLLEKPVDPVALIAAVASLAVTPIRINPARPEGTKPSWTS
jgi:CheY-like chemotaxis protein